MDNDDFDNVEQLADPRLSHFSLENNSKDQNIDDMHELKDNETH
jgi:hypothetical protein